MGKSSAKTIFSIAVGLASAYFSGFGSGLSFLQRAAYGLALGSTVWSAIWGKQSQTYSFNAAQNKLGMDQMIPIIYGTRKWAGGLGGTNNRFAALRSAVHEKFGIEAFMGSDAACADGCCERPDRQPVLSDVRRGTAA